MNLLLSSPVLLEVGTEKIRFVLFEKLAKLEGIDLYLLIGSGVLAVILAIIAVIAKRKSTAETEVTVAHRVVFGVLFAAIGFILTYAVTFIIQATSHLLEEFGEVDISQILAYKFTAEQFSSRLVISFAVALLCGLVYGLATYFARRKNTLREKINPLRALVFGALAISLSFALSYIKLFSMPFGGSITLFSMLPIMLYANWTNPRYGFLAAFAYGILQIIQGAYVVHWAQFILDYFLAFTCLGLASFFPKSPELGFAASGFARMACSVVSGAIFYASSAPEGMNAWVYSLAYNGSTIGVDTLLCIGVYCIPAVNVALTAVQRQIVKEPLIK